MALPPRQFINREQVEIVFFSFWSTILLTRLYIFLYYRSYSGTPQIIIHNAHIHHVTLGFLFLGLAGFLFLHKRKATSGLLLLLGSALGLIIDEIGFLLNVESYWELKNFWAILASGFIFTLLLALLEEDDIDEGRGLVQRHRNPEHPYISVVIPAFNEERFLERTLLSFCCQNDQDFELIVVDNGSSDSTAEIADTYGARIICEEFRGVGFARQRGFLRAKGKIIASTDADTVVPSHWIEEIRKRFEKQEKLLAFGGAYNLYSGALITRLAVRHFFKPVWFMDRIFMGNWTLPGSNMAVRRSALLQVGGFRPDLQLGEDANLSHRLASIGKVAFDFNFLVKTSGRRFRHGLLFGLMTYAPNGFVRMLLKRDRFVKLPVIRTESSFFQKLSLLPLLISLLLLSYLFYSFNATFLQAKEQNIKEINFFLRKAVSENPLISDTKAVKEKYQDAVHGK